MLNPTIGFKNVAGKGGVVAMPQITITVDIDDEVGDVTMTIDEVHANGITVKRNTSDETPA
jgi:hypothetical protein